MRRWFRAYSFALLCLLLLGGAETFTQAQNLADQGNDWFQRGQFQKAVETYRLYLESNPNDPEIRTNLGAALSRLGRHEEAIEEYEKALATGSVDNPAPIEANLGLAYYRASDFGRAENYLRKALEGMPGHRNLLLLLADVQLRQSQPAEAVETLAPFENQLEDDRDFVHLYARALVEADRLERAAQWIEPKLDAWDSAPLYQSMALVEFKRSAPERAQRFLKAAFQIDASLAGLNSLYGKTLRQQGKLMESVEYFERELTFNPGDFDANLFYGIHLYENDGEYEEALRRFAAALEKEPGDPLARYHMGLIRLLQGENQEALRLLEGVVKDRPHFARGHAALARLHLKLKNRDLAARYQERADELRRQQQASHSKTGSPVDTGSDWEAEWKNTDLSQALVDLDSIYSGGPPKEGIPAIDRPRFVQTVAAAGWIDPREPVVILELDGRVRLYPLQILIWHEIVNDRLGDTPICLSFCPLCYSAIAFDRRVGDQILDFGASGLLRHNAMLMYDRQTESLWQQITGKAIVGRWAGQELHSFPTRIVSFEKAREQYPDALVLSRDTGFQRNYGRNPYVGYDDIEARPYLGGRDIGDRLRPMERVVAVVLDGKSKVYPFDALRSQPVVNDRLNSVPVVVFYENDTRSALDEERVARSRSVGSAAVFDRRLGPRTLSFREREGRLLDEQTGSEWNSFGVAVSGALEGERLEEIPSSNVFAFAWLVFRPDTEIYRDN